MITENLNLLLADDDNDDCQFFEEALKDLNVFANLSIVNNGEELMQLLFEKIETLPDILFLDLNMPRKNGFECLAEIKSSGKLSTLIVIIISTSFERDMVEKLYKNGANFYIRKPIEFAQLKNVIFQALTLATSNNATSSAIENFVLKGDNK
ncbi:MAG TPA: response regulator [Saprospiraceae bacterium]|nr:response regulator [Saprospiraceae bacterium]